LRDVSGVACVEAARRRRHCAARRSTAAAPPQRRRGTALRSPELDRAPLLPPTRHGQESDGRLRAAEAEISRTKAQGSKLPGLAKLLKGLM